MAELPELGKHCSKDNCNRLDFLPLCCEHCSKIYCKDHYSVNGHSCTEFQKKDVFVESTTLTKVIKCSVVGCEDACGTVHHSCASCGAQICLKHRHNSPQSHGCPSAQPKLPSATVNHREQFTKAFNAVEKEINGKLEAASRGKRKETAERIRLMRLKSRAVCHPGMSIPMESRAYFTVSSPRSTPPSSLPLYISRMWSLGKAVDIVEKIFKLHGKSYGKPGLILERNSSNICSDLSQTVASLLENGILVEGDALILEYVDPEKI